MVSVFPFPIMELDECGRSHEDLTGISIVLTIRLSLLALWGIITGILLRNRYRPFTTADFLLHTRIRQETRKEKLLVYRSSLSSGR